MLRAVHGNRVEDLFSALDQALPAADPFAPVTLVVGSHVVARWLSRELAMARGIAAGLAMVTFDDFVEQVWASDAHARAAGLRALDRRRLGAALASVLADDDVVRTLPPVAAYLAAAPAPGDRAGPRRVQLAEHLADLAWQYALTRPDWMPALVMGQVPGELADDPMARWQAVLLGAAIARLGPASSGPGARRPAATAARWVPLPMLPWLRRRAQLPPPQLDAPVIAFGMSFLARGQLEALTDLAATTDVSVYILDPCQELWDDVAGRGGRDEAGLADPLPLVLWGRPVRDTLAALVERTGGDLDARFAPEPVVRTAREQLLADVQRRASRAASGLDRASPLGEPMAAAVELADPGVTVLACPNGRREMEVIASEVRRHLDAEPTLSAHEIAVWIAGDAETYLAQAPSAFEAVGVPCHLIDAPIDDRGRIGEAVLALLELPTGTMARRDLLRVMTHPAVLAAHPHVDAADWVRWTERLGIVHGADASAHAGTYLEEHAGHFHWDQGVRRLALGAFMVGERATRGAVAIGDATFAPEEVRPDQQASAATYALLVRSLCADASWLASHEATLGEWADVFAGLVTAYLAPRDEEAKRDLERVRAMLASLAALDVDGRRVGFREAREHAARRLGSARANRGEPLAGGVMVAPLAAMRGVPFRVVFVAGLDEGAFPASDTTSPLDLRREARAGDVSPRDRDRAAFLDVLLCARDALYLSYVAVEAKSGQPLGPSSVVLELADALAPYLGAPAASLAGAGPASSMSAPLAGAGPASSMSASLAGAGPASSMSGREALARLTVRHPLHRFGAIVPDSGGADAVLPVVARERWGCAVRDALRAHLRAGGHPIPDEDGLIALLAHPSQHGLRVELGIEDAPAAAPATDAATRSLSIPNLRKFLEHPVQAWAQAVLGLDELPDDEVLEHSDEPFHLDKPRRATVLRDVLAAQLRDPGGGGSGPSRALADRYDAVMHELQLRGQSPVGVFAEAARELDLALLETWRDALGPVEVGGATRFGFGRLSLASAAVDRAEGAGSHPGAELLPALALELPGGRSVQLVGQTELLVRGATFTSVIMSLSEPTPKHAYHLRGALDHVVLAAAGLAPAGHAHLLLGPDGKQLRVTHAPWTQADARAYLGALIAELLDRPHGYLLPFDELVKALAGNTKPGGTRASDPGKLLGYGPIERRDGLQPPPDAIDIARRRLRPLVERMQGDHKFELAKAKP